ncbi:hypothetical protein L1887_25274 [Cichorium endivia]|nr:hypothetical protein L1887_25274 [Cichorium endivia]
MKMKLMKKWLKNFRIKWNKTMTLDGEATEQQILVTGIKVADLLAPYQRGGKIGLFGGEKPTVVSLLCWYL